MPYVPTLRYVTLRYGSKRTDQRYVTVSYVTLRYVRVETGIRHKTTTIKDTSQDTQERYNGERLVGLQNCVF